MAHPVRSLEVPERVVAGAKRVSRLQRQLVERGLSHRELAVLRDIDRFRFLTSKQVERLHFHAMTTKQSSTRICNRVLQRLYSYRVIEHLERRVGGVRAGSASYVWMVGPTGEHVLRADDAVRVRRREPSLYFMRHCLAIADCVIALQEGAAHSGYELTSVTTEPGCWRRFLARTGTSETLKPDLAVTTTQGEFQDSWFIEVDRATESIPTLIKKCRQYLAYQRTDQEQAEHGVFPAVLWVLPTEQRAERLAAALTSAHSLDASLFRLTTPDALVATVAGGAA